MSLMDLKSEDAICCSNDYSYISKDKSSLLLGQSQYYDYMIYLYFNLPSYSYLKNLKQAKIILFKLPIEYKENQTDYKDELSEYSVYPLLNFFSTYSYIFCKPSLDHNLRVNFKNIGCSYNEIDITLIVKAWIEERRENKGIILMRNNVAKLISYANNNPMIGMRPRLRLIYDDNWIYPPLVSTPSIVKITKPKK